MFDYEHAAGMHHWNGRLATRVLVPDAIPEAALARYGMRPPKLVRYPGLKEEYSLADARLDPDGVRAELGLDERLVAVLRPPPEVTLYHRGHSGEVFAATLERLLDAPEAQVVVLPRTEDQRAALRGRPAIVPERPVDGPSLIAAADVVISAGGTMNREAAVLGVPAYTPFAARLGAVDRRLIAQGRLRRLERPGDVVLTRRDGAAAPALRDPEWLLDLILLSARTTVEPAANPRTGD
jgi:predicted glycosyltransferase